VIKGFLSDQGYQVVFGNQADDSASPVGDWEGAVVSLTRFVDIIHSLNSM